MKPDSQIADYDIFDVHKPEEIQKIIIDPTHKLPHLYIILVCHDKTIYGSIIKQSRYDTINTMDSAWYPLFFKAKIQPGFMKENEPKLS